MSVKEKLYKFQQRTIINLIEIILVGFLFVLFISGWIVWSQSGVCYCNGIPWREENICPSQFEFICPLPPDLLDVFFGVSVLFLVFFIGFIVIYCLLLYLKYRKIDRI